ncbi:MAG: hypothetical protein VCB25_05780 [Myxococcota bacterium]
MPRRKNKLSVDQRRFLAMQNPMEQKVTKNPKLRQIEMIGKAASASKHYVQMASFLQIELDTPPAWHVSIAMLDTRGGDGGELLTAFNWTEWMSDRAEQLVRSLIPDYNGPGQRIYRDIHKHSVDYHQRLTQDEITRLHILKAA